MKKTIRVREAGAIGNASPGQHVVKDCKLLGLQSSNGRRYLEEAVRKALSMYEGVAVYIDHPDAADPSPRRFADKFGFIRGVRYQDGVRGDLHYNPRHPLAETFLGWLEVNPSMIGLSHSAVGSAYRDEDGADVVDEISEVESVDLVATPATTKGLFESMQVQEYQQMHDPLAGLTGNDATPPGVADPAAAPAEPETAPTLDATLSALIAGIIADQAMDVSQKKKKILMALNLMEDPEEVKPSVLGGKMQKDEMETPDLDVPGEGENESGEEPDFTKEDEEKMEAAVNKAIARIEAVADRVVAILEAKAKVKAPTSLAPDKMVEDKPLTVEALVEGINKQRSK